MKKKSNIWMVFLGLCSLLPMAVWAGIDDVYYWQSRKPVVTKEETHKDETHVDSLASDLTSKVEPTKKVDTEVVLEQDTVVKIVIRR